MGSLSRCGLSPAGALGTGPERRIPEEASVENLRYLALGDSYTIGEGVDSTERWPNQLSSRLRALGHSVRDPEIIASTGWTTDELSEAMDEARLSGPFALVSLLIGVNNQYRGRDAEEYRTQLASLLDQAVILAGGRPARVLVLSIPDWGVTPFAEGGDREAIAREIDAFNQICHRETQAVGARWVNVTEISRDLADPHRWMTSDGLHPSGEMYSRWVDEALPTVMDMLGIERGNPRVGGSPDGG